jgi:EAL domain-containing protein (putative c-di-GMP-specific phosphodiesterase class I)
MGDEFVVAGEGLEIEGAMALASHLQGAFADSFPIAGGLFHVTANFGVASILALGPTDVLASADIAMYAAKRAGGNKVVAYEEERHGGLQRRIAIEQELFGALRRNELRIVFQPILQVPDRTLLVLEALLRWEHPRLGSVPPGEFILIAEETGQIAPFGAWVLDQAVAELRRWRDGGLPIYVSVNVSGHQLADAAFPTQLARALAAQGLPPVALIIEITEIVLMQDSAVRLLREVRSQGVRVAVDDFGTGYSSLAYLSRLPVDILKIDQSFLRTVGEGPAQSGFFGAVVRMAHRMGLGVVAEDVEEGLQWHYLRARRRRRAGLLARPAHGAGSARGLGRRAG